MSNALVVRHGFNMAGNQGRGPGCGIKAGFPPAPVGVRHPAGPPVFLWHNREVLSSAQRHFLARRS